MPGRRPRTDRARRPGQGGCPAIRLQTEIQVAEGTSQSDRADVGRHRRGRGLERHEGARDFASLMIDPSRFVALRGAPASLINLQQSGIHDAIGEGLQRERTETQRRIGRDDPSTSRGQMLEIFNDDAAVVERRPILQDQRRDFPSGFSRRIESVSLPVSASTTVKALDKPSRDAAILTLRPKGDAGAERRIIMVWLFRFSPSAIAARKGPDRSAVGIRHAAVPLSRSGPAETGREKSTDRLGFRFQSEGRIDDIEPRSFEPLVSGGPLPFETERQPAGKRKAAKVGGELGDRCRVLDRIPKDIDARRPFADRPCQGSRQGAELVRLLKGRIDENEAAPFGRRNRGVQHAIAIMREDLDPLVTAQAAFECDRFLRMTLAQKQVICRPQEMLGDGGGAGVALRLAAAVARTDDGEIGSEQGQRVVRCAVYVPDAVPPLTGPASLVAAEIVPTSPRMGIDVAERRRLPNQVEPGSRLRIACLKTSAKLPAWKACR